MSIIDSPLPERWEYTTLGEVCKRGGGLIQTGPFGSQLHASDYVPFGVPSIMPVNIGDNQIVTQGIARISEIDAERLSRYRVRPGDIVYSRRGDVERCSLVREQQNGWLCGTGCLMIRLGDGVTDPRFASFYLKHPAVKEWILRHALGATMPNLNTSIMQSVPFILPPLPTQHAIARILGSLDDKIELNRQMNETLEAMARAIFKSWFVDFDPVRAKAEGRQPAGMDAETAALFPGEIVEVDGREVPKGWGVETLGEVIDLAYGEPLKEENRRGGSIPVYGSNGQIGWHDEKLVDGPGIIVGRKGNPGIIHWSATDFFPIDTTFFVVPKKQDFSLYYLYHELQRQDLPSLSADSAVPGLNRNMAYMSSALTPPDAILKRFDDVMKSLDGVIQNNEQQSRTLGEIRDALLPKLMSGEINIGRIEI